MEKGNTFALKSRSGFQRVATNTSTSNLSLYKPKTPMVALSPKPDGVATDRKAQPFLEEDGFTDLVLNVEGQRLFTSKMLLSMCSPVFSRMLSSTPGENSGTSDDDSHLTGLEGKTQDLHLTGKSFEHVQELLYVLHPAYQRKITESTAFAILPLAEEYEIWNLKQKCEETLLNSLHAVEKQPSEALVLKCLHNADRFKLFALWTKCLQICSKPCLSLGSLQKAPEYSELSKFLKSMLEAFKENESESSQRNGGSIHNSTNPVTTRLDGAREGRKISASYVTSDNSRKPGVNIQTQTRY